MALDELTIEEIVELGVLDAELYCRTFFPRTVRQPFAPMHEDAWSKLDSQARLVNLLMFRGAGKTSHCRLYTSKAIAYGIANTILYIGKSEGHAIRSTSWIKKQVEENTLWAGTFELTKGSKWQDTEFEICLPDIKDAAGNTVKRSIWVMAAGITGSVRGVNRDDFRPDLIVLDDVLDDENAHTEEQRMKIERLVYGALMESLAPKSEAPHAKMIGLNTPQHKEDFAVKALKDPSWTSAVYGCWSKETAQLPTDYQESAWEDRLPTPELRKEKRSAAGRNMLSTFLREKECRLTAPEKAAFRASWLNYYKEIPTPLTTIYSIDPVPPPSEKALSKGLLGNDFEAHVIWGAYKDDRYLLDYELKRGHQPTWTIKTFFELQRKWRPFKTRVESVAYQRVLMWILKNAMDEAQAWYAIEEYQSRQTKYNRIIASHNGKAAAGKLYVRPDQVDFIEQFSQYPDVSNDDLLDASSMCLDGLEGLYGADDGSLIGAHDTTAGHYRPLNISVAP